MTPDPTTDALAVELRQLVDWHGTDRFFSALALALERQGESLARAGMDVHRTIFGIAAGVMRQTAGTMSSLAESARKRSA